MIRRQLICLYPFLKHALSFGALAVVDVVFVMSGAVVCVAGMPSTAHAYVDPSVMTYTIQALAGVAVALSAVLGVFWRRTRRFVLKVLHIDENHGKAVEPSVHRIAPDEAASADAQAQKEVAASKKGGSENAKDLFGYGKRFGFALAAMALIMYVVFVAAPFELVDGNSSSLSFDVKDILLPIFTFAIIAGVVCALLLALLRGRKFFVVLAIVVGVGVCAFMQPLFMNAGLPGGDSGEIIWGDYALTMLVNALIWLAVIGVLALFAVKKAYASSFLCLFLSVALIVTQTVALVRPLYHAMISPGRTTMTQEGLFDVSGGEDVIVLLVDTVDNVEVEALCEGDPSLFDSFNGFTYFPNSTGVMQATRYAVPNLLTGEAPRDDDTPESYVLDRWNRSTFLQEIKDAGYDISLYSDLLYKNREQFEALMTNMKSLERIPIDWVGSIMSLGKAALYRDAPWALKPLFTYSTPELVSGVLGSVDLSENLGAFPYEIDDVDFYNRLKEYGLKVADDSDADFFKIIHLEGAHTPYTMNENAERVDVSTLVAQIIGTLRIVSEYVDQLKALGVYEDTTIIVTADHGHWYWPVTEMPTEPASPFLMVKPAGVGADAPFEVSWAPVSQEDFQATVMKAVGGDWQKWGQTYFDIPEDADRVRYWNMMTWTPETADREWIQLKIDGNALDINNWSETGKVWYFNGFNPETLPD